MADPFSLTIPRRVGPTGSSGGSAGGTGSVTSHVVPATERTGLAGYIGNVLPAALAAASAFALVISAARLISRRERRAHQREGTVTIKSELVNNSSNDSKLSSQHNIVPDCSKYEKLREIGRGAFGVVYVGRHTNTGELVAIKEMSIDVADELRTEYTLLAGLHNEHIVDIRGFEVGRKHARLYLEWVAGGSLADILKYHSISDERLLASYTRQIVLGLKMLHEHGILHRDIKPRNILVDHKGALKLTDFGLSRHLESMQDRTRCAGTPIYMSPECMQGRFSVGSDIWAVGATLVEMASGTLPWSHIDPHIFSNQVSLMVHIAKFQGEAGHHPLIPSFLSPTAVAFIQRCFSPRAEDRGTCDDLLTSPFLSSSASVPVSTSEGCTNSVGCVTDTTETFQTEQLLPQSSINNDVDASGDHL